MGNWGGGLCHQGDSERLLFPVVYKNLVCVCVWMITWREGFISIIPKGALLKKLLSGGSKGCDSCGCHILGGLKRSRWYCHSGSQCCLSLCSGGLRSQNGFVLSWSGLGWGSCGEDWGLWLLGGER